MIVLDSSTDLVPGDDPARIGGTLDTAVHAAAALAEHYLRAGDRVGLIDDGPATRTVLPAAGRAHLDRIVDALIDVDTEPGRRTAAVRLARTARPDRPPGDGHPDHPAARGCARPEWPSRSPGRGTPCWSSTASATTPPNGAAGSTADLAWRLQRLQHDVDIDRLADAGIPTAAWRRQRQPEHRARAAQPRQRCAEAAAMSASLTQDNPRHLVAPLAIRVVVLIAGIALLVLPGALHPVPVLITLVGLVGALVSTAHVGVGVLSDGFVIGWLAAAGGRTACRSPAPCPPPLRSTSRTCRPRSPRPPRSVRGSIRPRCRAGCAACLWPVLGAAPSIIAVDVVLPRTHRQRLGSRWPGWRGCWCSRGVAVRAVRRRGAG